MNKEYNIVCSDCIKEKLKEIFLKELDTFEKDKRMGSKTMFSWWLEEYIETIHRIKLLNEVKEKELKKDFAEILKKTEENK